MQTRLLSSLQHFPFTKMIQPSSLRIPVVRCFSHCTRTTQPACNRTIKTTTNSSILHSSKLLRRTFVPLGSSRQLSSSTTFTNTVDTPTIITTTTTKESVTQTAVDTLHMTGDLNPVALLVRGLDQLHHCTDLPWWATIVGVTVLTKLTLLPALVIGHRSAMREAQASSNLFQSEEPKNLKNHPKAAGNSNNITGDHMQFGVEVASARRDGVHQPSANAGVGRDRMLQFLPALSPPVLCSLAYGVWRLADHPFAEFKTGGFGWITDLTAADPYRAMPVLSVATFYLAVRSSLAVSVRTGVYPDSALKKLPVMLNLLTGVCAVPLLWWNPAAAPLLVWTTNNLVTIGTYSMFVLRPVRQLLRMPPLLAAEKAKFGSGAFRKHGSKSRLFGFPLFK